MNKKYIQSEGRERKEGNQSESFFLIWFALACIYFLHRLTVSFSFIIINFFYQSTVYRLENISSRRP